MTRVQLTAIPWGAFTTEWVHILAGIYWFGSSLFGNLVLVPALNRLPLEQQKETARAIGRYAPWAARVAATLVIVMGIVRGTVYGRIKSSDVLFHSRYGIVWLIALVVAGATFAWGEGAIAPRLRLLSSNDPAYAVQPDGTMSPAAAALVATLKLFVGLELLGFFTIFTSMILLQFS
jgi:uncharacterized membrane protein